LLKLKRVEIHGFKSFYDRTEMKFKGQGIAAVVGPNGCGKSNLSDAINWVLGEQSAKSLRGARMEDVIFAGTRERKPLGMASVTMTLVADEFGLRPKLSAPSSEVSSGGAESEEPSDPANAEGPRPVDIEGAEHSHESRNGFSHHTDQAHEGHSKSDRHGLDKTGAERTAERTGEITITRRLYRSGESEYLINGKLARLRDIQDLFLGTGLGPESYAIIEQGRIGQILSNKPQDRRAVIEEAAGITKFKTRKRLAEAKLEGAKQNLSRVFDILEEVNRQVNTLKRQAAKAKRYEELRTEMVGYLKQVLAGKFQILERESAKTAIERNLASAELHAVQASVSSQEEQQTGVIETSYAVDQELTEARKQLSALQVEAERSRTRLEYQLKQIEAINGRLASTEIETAALEKQGAETEAELEGQAGELAHLEEERAAAREALNEKSAERQDAQSRLTERERGLEALRQQVMRLLSEVSSLKNRLSQTEAQLTGLDREATRARGEEQQSQSDLERIQRVKDEISQRLSARQTELTSITDQRREVEQSLQSKRAALQNTRQAVDRLRSEHSRIKARRDSLEEVISHRSYTTETVKRLFTAIAKGQANALNPVGVLADFLEVDPQYEKATEEFLHEELEYVVVRDWVDAEHGIDLLRNGIDGRATFLVEKLNDISAESGGESRRPSAEDGLVGRLTDALRFSNGLSSAPLDLLPRVANCYFASDHEAAQRLAVQFPRLWFLAPDGISYHGHSVTGGKKTGAGPLALKRELREVSQLEKTRQQELTSTQNQLTDLERDIASLSEHLEVLRQQQQSQEKDVLALDHETRKLAEEFQRANARLSSARLELDRIGRERGKLEESLVAISGELEAKETARFDQEQAFDQVREELGELQAAVARVTEEHSTLRANLASFEERHRALTSAKTRLDSRLAEIMERLHGLAADRQRLATEHEQLLGSNSELEGRGRELKDGIASHSETVQQLAAKEAELRAQIASAEESLKALRQNAQTLQERRSTLQVAMARLESDLKYLDETSRNELQIAIQELSAAMETVPSEEEAIELESKYADVRRKIEALGPVNPQALEEYEESQQRQEFLNAQRQDLLDSIRDTEKAIHEIDIESRKRFSEAFHAINGNFTEMFKTLFGGGLAEMRLTDEENVSESGIDIVASPPGKRLQSVLLLSGGEKALTAMALLMAVFQYTPSPFCILDEVDAPLDEPNIQRLTRLLGSMSEQTQFIVITHAKRTMEAAQSLYGVTMQEPGVSRLVSVKFKPMEEVERNSSAIEAKERERELAMA
jgi:chromosome segregation protein